MLHFVRAVLVFCAATDLILQNIAFGTEIGIKCSKILACGGSVSEEIILRIIQEKIESPEVAHHGNLH